MTRYCTPTPPFPSHVFFCRPGVLPEGGYPVARVEAEDGGEDDEEGDPVGLPGPLQRARALALARRGPGGQVRDLQGEAVRREGDPVGGMQRRGS